MTLFIEIKEIRGYNSSVGKEGSFFKPYNWKKRLEEHFPHIPSGDDKKAYSDFLNRVHRYYSNHKAGRWGGDDWGFSWFFQIVKLANRKYKEENIFILWLWLCAARPWQKKTFFMEWGEGKKEDYYKILDILKELRDKFGLQFSSVRNISGIKTFYRYQKDDMVRVLITSVFTMGYSAFWRDRAFGRNYLKFVKLLKSGTLVTKREFQRKLRINSARLQFFIEQTEEKGMVKVMKLSKNSIGLFYRDPS